MKWNRFLGMLLMSLFIVFSNQNSRAQESGTSPELLQIIKGANSALDKGDFASSIALFKQGIILAPDNVGLRKDLAYAYLLNKELDKARETIDPVVNSSAADAQCFQIAAGIELADGKNSKAKRIVNKGLEKFPSAGVLYNTKGNIEITGAKSNKEAISTWIKGIAAEPNYATNYFNLSNALSENKEYVWVIIYAEKYINLDQQSPKSVDMRRLLFETYKKVLTSNTAGALPEFNASNDRNNSKISFEDAVRKALGTNISTVSDGYTTDNISMLRSRFLIYWNNNYADRFPQSIFTYQTRLMKAGNFPAYNQWLFGAIENTKEFGIWVSQFRSNYQDFEKWKLNNQFVPSMGDAGYGLN